MPSGYVVRRRGPGKRVPLVNQRIFSHVPSCLASGRPPLTQVRRTQAFEVSLLLGAGEVRTGEVVSGRHGGGPERKRDASASRSFSYHPPSPGLGAASATAGVRQLILLVSQVLGVCPGEPKGHGRRGERTASG